MNYESGVYECVYCGIEYSHDECVENGGVFEECAVEIVYIKNY